MLEVYYHHLLQLIKLHLQLTFCLGPCRQMDMLSSLETNLNSTEMTHHY